MPGAVEEPQLLVGEDWHPSTVEDPGAAELAARIEAATPVAVPRSALEGRCGLADRELWQLGVRTEPAGVLSTGGGVLLRLGVLCAIAAMGFFLAMVGVGAVTIGDPDSAVGVPGTIALLLFGLGLANVSFRLAWSAAGRERERRLAQRRVVAEPVPPLHDPNGRLTVAVLQGPGVLRVLLLWLRGHPRDADMLEARVIAERRVPRDDPGRAEDAVVALSDVAMLAGRLRGPAGEVEPPSHAALAPGKASALVAHEPGAATRTASRQRVGPDWQPDGTTEEGEAELARRLCLARPITWSAELLAPLVVDDVRDAELPPPPLPLRTQRERRRGRPMWITAPAAALIALLLCFVASDPSAGLGTEIAMRTLFGAAAAWVTWKAFKPQILELPQLWRRRRLMRRVDDAACDAAASLESGLPGANGAVTVLRAERDGRQLVRLAHLRRLVDAPEATLEVRVLAERRLEREDDVRETVGRFLIVADDQAFTTLRGRQWAQGLRRLSRRLGMTAGHGGGRGTLLREPLTVAAVAGVALTLVMLVDTVLKAVGGGIGEGAIGLALAVAAAIATVALVACERRWLAAHR